MLRSLSLISGTLWSGHDSQIDVRRRCSHLAARTRKVASFRAVPVEKPQGIGEGGTERGERFFHLSAPVEPPAPIEREVIFFGISVDCLKTRDQAFESRRRKQRRQHRKKVLAEPVRGSRRARAPIQRPPPRRRARARRRSRPRRPASSCTSYRPRPRSPGCHCVPR